MQAMRIETPVIILNFKTYVESLGKAGLVISKQAQQVSEELGVCIAIAPQFVDLRMIAEQVSIPVLSQSVDAYTPGAHTGSISVESIKEAGACGTLINHSEKRLTLSDIGAIVTKVRSLGMTSVVCADTPNVAKAASALNPDFVAIEPPELIGTGIPVSKAKPEVVTESMTEIKRVSPSVKVICGAGISTGEDVYVALKLGTCGVLLASGVVKAKDPEKVLREMAEAVHRYKVSSS
jgi:triosephosphate isomerase